MAGELVRFPRTLKLIAIRFGESVMVVCGVELVVDPTARCCPGRSSGTRQVAGTTAG